MAERYTQDDPRVQPVPLDAYAWSPIPPPPTADATVAVSLLPTSTLTLDPAVFTTYARPGDKVTCPCFSFLVEKDGRAILWDLGLREDPQNAPKKITEHALKQFAPHPGPGPIKRLTEGGYDLSKLDLVILSHEHFDRSLESIGPGAPDDPNAAWPAAWLATYRFVELPPASAAGEWAGDVAALRPPGRARRWQRLACFERAVDWFGDGSFWLIDAPGHSPGHIMALARVTADPPTYICLGGDASHSQDLYLPVPRAGAPDARSANPVVDGVPTLAVDPAAAMRTIGGLTRLSAEDNVMVVLAHETEAGDVLPPWPAALGGWRAAGWKEDKERAVYARAGRA